MRRFAIVVSMLVLLPFASACGSAARQQPSVTVKYGPVLQFQGREVHVFILTPSGEPGGIIALKSVRDGHVETLGSFRFDAMSGAGSTAVEVSRHDIDASWSIPTMASWLPDGPVSFPAGSVAAVTAWADGTYGPAEQSGEQVIWIQGRFIGHQPANDSEQTGAFAAVVSLSKQTPDKTSFCLTLQVDGR